MERTGLRADTGRGQFRNDSKKTGNDSRLRKTFGPKQSDAMALGCSQTTECSLQESIEFMINCLSVTKCDFYWHWAYAMLSTMERFRLHRERLWLVSVSHSISAPCIATQPNWRKAITRKRHYKRSNCWTDSRFLCNLVRTARWGSFLRLENAPE